jgi:hypothetical protein
MDAVAETTTVKSTVPPQNYRLEKQKLLGVNAISGIS